MVDLNIPERMPASSNEAGRIIAGVSPRLGGATFSRRHRMIRLVWIICWFLLARWTPPQLQPLRRALLVLFGARIHPTAMVRGTVNIWWPGNLTMGPRSTLGPGVRCYNVAEVSLGEFANVSQRAHLCTASHAVDHVDFELTSAPIAIGANAWVAAEAFVGPGATIGEGAVLAARGVTARALDPWTIYAGNPAVPKRQRRITA